MNLTQISTDISCTNCLFCPSPVDKIFESSLQAKVRVSFASGAMPYISPKYRSNLSKYKYSGTDKSLLSRYVLNPFWNRLVKVFPLWVA